MSEETILEVEGLKKSYGKLDVLKSINFELKRGEVVFFIRPSGSVKSTMLRCLNLLEMPEPDLYARACRHGWSFACGKTVASR
mgnify:CR=1 FL=1